MIKKYLEENTYRFEIHADFVKDGNYHAVITEYGPSGQEEDTYILVRKQDGIYNMRNEKVD